MKSVVDLKRLWHGSWTHFSAQKIPGKVVKSNVRMTKQILTVDLAVPLFDRNGVKVQSVTCEVSGGARLGSFVAVKVRNPAQSPTQVDADIRAVYGSITDYESAVEAFGREHRAWIDLAEAAGPLSDPVKAAEEEIIRLSTGLTETKRQLSEQEQRIFTAQAELKQERDRVEADQRRASAVLALKDELDQEVREFNESGAKAVTHLLRPFLPKTSDCHRDADRIPVSELLRHFIASAKQLGYVCDDFTALQFVGALCSSVRTGQFIVLTGPTGIGKTSLVTLAAQIYQCGSGVVPVRPAWIDSSDLIGFFDLRNQRFHPTPLMDYLLEASDACSRDHLFLLTLDEMNLARIENYAGDLLSRLEKVIEGDGVLQLYSAEVSRSLMASIGDLKQDVMSCSTVSPELADRVSLRQHLERYPTTFRLPQGLCIFGTLNIDETTYVPSPKFLDRSFVLQMWPPSVATVMKPTAANDGFVQRMISLSEVKALTFDRENPHFAAVASAVTSNQAAITELQIHLGFRLAQAAEALCSFAYHWRDVLTLDVVDALFLSKILPKLSFHEDERCPSGELKKDVLETWALSDSISPYKRSQAALERIVNAGGPVFRYLE